MNKSAFRFKQFYIDQDQCAMKLGMDACVFGAWMNGGEPVLDVGTGTGILALMAAQRFPNTSIDAIELDEKACDQAAGNFAHSPWKQRLKAIQCDFKQYSTTVKYEHIISNPPYFVDSLKSEDAERNQARHDDSLPLKEFFTQSKSLLTAGGKVSLIFPAHDPRLPQLALEQGFFVHRKCSLLPNPGKEAVRTMWEFGLKPGEFEESTLVLESHIGRRLSLAAWKLLNEFYLEL
jgi:tRNA1Val (adenine37-N6)-methyltransferase